MTPATRKAKGRSLVLEIKKWLHYLFPSLVDHDVIIPAISANGMDLKLSPTATSLFPYAIEAKRVESLATDYRFMEQAKANSEGLTPLVIMRSNRKPTLIMMYLDDFEKLVKG